MDVDPNLLAIVLGLITNGLTSLIATSGKTAGNLLIGKEFREKWELEKTSLAPILHSAIQSVAENVEWKGSVRQGSNECDSFERSGQSKINPEAA